MFVGVVVGVGGWDEEGWCWGRRMRKSVSMCELRVWRAVRGVVWWRGMCSDVIRLRRWVGC